MGIFKTLFAGAIKIVNWDFKNIFSIRPTKLYYKNILFGVEFDL